MSSRFFNWCPAFGPLRNGPTFFRLENCRNGWYCRLLWDSPEEMQTLGPTQSKTVESGSSGVPSKPRAKSLWPKKARRDEPRRAVCLKGRQSPEKALVGQGFSRAGLSRPPLSGARKRPKTGTAAGRFSAPKPAPPPPFFALLLWRVGPTCKRGPT